MKNLLKIAAFSSFAFFMASCGSANDVYGNNNPNNGVYRSSDGTVYRQGEIYRDRNGNVYQNGRIVRNYPSTTKRLPPPGQAKKIYGGSAKDYAPGQVKKRNAYANNGPVFRNDDQKKYKRNDDRKFENKKDHDKKGQKKGKRK